MVEHPASPRPAATVLIVRQAEGPEPFEVFMVKRHHRSGFMASAHVFPGGRVDPADHARAQSMSEADRTWAAASLGQGPQEGVAALAFFLAAVRETAEECGLVYALDGGGKRVDSTTARAIFDGLLQGQGFWEILEEGGLTPQVRSLSQYAWWVTPKMEPKRYDTRFFLALAPAGHEGSFDRRETVDAGWFSPKNALAAYHSGEILLAPPTMVTLEDLQGLTAMDQIEKTALSPSQAIEPVITQNNGGDMVLALPGDPLHPEKANIYPGRTRIVLDSAGKFISAQGPSST